MSGSSGALLRRRPLRTGRASRLASGSSHSSAPDRGTEQFDGAILGTTTDKVVIPDRIEWVGATADLDVPRNRDRRCLETLQPVSTVSCTIRGKDP